jgi:glc operon protein GlcG
MVKLLNRKSLSLEDAKALISFATQKAKELGVGGAIALVDNGGHLICLERIDGTMIAAANIAFGKAATAVGFKRPGKVLEKTVSEVRVAMQTLGNVTPAPFVPLMGGYPIVVEGEVVGGIAVAGAENGENDEIIALYAIEKFMNS